ncbi:MAG: hypothetical protein ACKOU6_12760 [Planctomycetota bacterium]
MSGAYSPVLRWPVLRWPVRRWPVLRRWAPAVGLPTTRLLTAECPMI